MTDASKPRPEPREAYRRFRPMTTRWMDNDLYGHLNNVVYYSLFDSAVNGYLIDAGALDIHAGGVIGLVVETHCNYFAPLAFPQLRVDASSAAGATQSPLSWLLVALLTSVGPLTIGIA